MIPATNVDRTYLKGDFHNASIATKMSWASRRTTAKPEDQAYCLLSIFNAFMDLRYGEGKMAFIRLQKELLASCNDESIFAWTSTASSHGMLAPEPACFRDSANITHISSVHRSRPQYEWTSQGIKFPIPMFFLDYGNGYEWNDLKAKLRSVIKVPLNCWRMDPERPKDPITKDPITIHLKKMNGIWQRDECDKMGLTKHWKVLNSLDFLGKPKTRNVYVPQNHLPSG